MDIKILLSGLTIKELHSIKTDAERLIRSKIRANVINSDNLNEEKSGVRLIDLDMRMRAINLLHSIDVYYLGQLSMITRNELLRIPGLGKRTLTEIEEMLRVKGLKFQK